VGSRSRDAGGGGREAPSADPCTGVFPARRGCRRAVAFARFCKPGASAAPHRRHRPSAAPDAAIPPAGGPPRGSDLPCLHPVRRKLPLDEPPPGTVEVHPIARLWIEPAAPVQPTFGGCLPDGPGPAPWAAARRRSTMLGCGPFTSRWRSRRRSASRAVRMDRTLRPLRGPRAGAPEEARRALAPPAAARLAAPEPRAAPKPRAAPSPRVAPQPQAAPKPRAARARAAAPRAGAHPRVAAAARRRAVVGAPPAAPHRPAALAVQTRRVAPAPR